MTRDQLLAEIERRRDAGDAPCESCDATGIDGRHVCSHCLGQKIVLTGEEYQALLLICGHLIDNDAILDAEVLDG